MVDALTCPPVAPAAKVYCPQDIHRKFGRAVCSVTVIPTLKAFVPTYSRFIEEVQGATLYNGGLLPIKSTASYIGDKGMIVGSSSFNAIYAFASMMMTFAMPFCWDVGTWRGHTCADAPAFQNNQSTTDPATNWVNRYHNIPAFSEVLQEMCDGGCFSDFLEIYIGINHTNGNPGCNTIYRGTLVGMDMETGLAWFKIRNNDVWNRYSDPIMSMPVLSLGNSKLATAGSVVHTIYNSRVTGPNAMATGVVSDNVGMMYDGSLPFEIIRTSMLVDEGAEGAPLLNPCGQVIGFIVGVTKNGTAIGITSAFMARIHNAIQDANCTPRCTSHAVQIASFGCWVYRHGTLGTLVYHQKSATDLNQNLMATAIGNGRCSRCGPNGPCGCGSGGDNYSRNEVYTYENGDMDKTTDGIVLDVAPCGPLARAVEECAVRDPNFGQMQKRFFQIEKGDVILRINGIKVGYGQQSPENILYSLEYCVCVDVDFLKAKENFRQLHTINVPLDDSLLWVGDFRPCCVPCLAFQPTDVLLGLAGKFQDLANQLGYTYRDESIISGVGPVVAALGDLLDHTGDLINSLQCWFNLIRWFSHTLPAAYRAAYFSNLYTLMTRLDEWIGFLASPQPYKMDMLGVPVFTPLSVGVAMTQLSRALFTIIAVPSTEAAIYPIPFFDFVCSFAHPNSACAFEKTVPNYLAIIGSKICQYKRAAAACPAPTGTGAGSVDTSNVGSGPQAANFAFSVDSDAVAREARARKRARSEDDGVEYPLLA